MQCRGDKDDDSGVFWRTSNFWMEAGHLSDAKILDLILPPKAQAFGH